MEEEVLQCKRCGKRFRLKDERYRGRAMPCSRCGGPVKIPGGSGSQGEVGPNYWFAFATHVAMASGFLALRHVSLGLGVLALAGIWVKPLDPYVPTLSAAGLWLGGAAFAREISLQQPGASVPLLGSALAAMALGMSG